MSDSPSRDDGPIFLGLDAEQPSWESARAVVLPVPYERTTSYGAGTARGPQALLEASAFIELYDEEFDDEPCRHGIFTAPTCRAESAGLGDAIVEIEAAARPHLEAGKFLVTLGGEHGLTTGPARAAARVARGPLGVVQFDAHADLRESYEGSRYSHASVMRRLVDDLGLPSLAVGLRSLSAPEAELIRDRNLPVIWSQQLHDDARQGSTARFESLLERLPEEVYLTFDVDYFDPSLLPATGTPEPGGGHWHETMRLLRVLFARKRVLAMDVVELAPVAGFPSSDFVAAKLVYKCLGYALRGQADRADRAG
ncbi:MAG: agmatinase [Acidobacteriota bacterium]